MDISEVARRSGIPASTLRYYEARGLIASIGRRGLRRLFAADVFDRLALIALGQSAGFALEDIARMFCPDGRVKIDRGLLSAKAGELDATIRQLSALRAGLGHAAVCPAPSHMECPTFRRLLGLAALRAGARSGKALPPSSRRAKAAPLRAPRATRSARRGS